MVRRLHRHNLTLYASKLNKYFIGTNLTLYDSKLIQIKTKFHDIAIIKTVNLRIKMKIKGFVAHILSPLLEHKPHKQQSMLLAGSSH